MKTPSIVPTARTVMLAALAAPVAALLAAFAPGAWIAAPAAAGTLLVLVLLDGTMAARLTEWHLAIPPTAEIGQPTAVGLSLDFAGTPHGGDFAFACDPRLAGGGRIDGAITRGAEGDWEAATVTRPTRRGMGSIDHVWIGWRGPLGLARRQVSAQVEAAVRIRPDLSPVRSPALQTLLRDAQFGLMARRLRGEGTQFEALVEYQPGMDRRRIDWKSSAKHVRLNARENEVERNNQIVFAFDCGQTMCEPVDGLPRIDRAISAALTSAYVALKGGDKVSLFGFAQRPEVATPFYAETGAFGRLQNAAAELDYHTAEPNFTLGLATLASRLQRRSLVILFSDFTDPTSAQLMLEGVGRLLETHIVLFVTFEDTELEELAEAEPAAMPDIAGSVAADTLLTQRAFVLSRLRQMGADVIEAPWQSLGFAVIDRYLAIKRRGRIG